MKTLQDYIDKLNSLNFKEMYNNDSSGHGIKQTRNWRLFSQLLMLFAS